MNYIYIVLMQRLLYFSHEPWLCFVMCGAHGFCLTAHHVLYCLVCSHAPLVYLNPFTDLPHLVPIHWAQYLFRSCFPVSCLNVLFIELSVHTDIVFFFKYWFYFVAFSCGFVWTLAFRFFPHFFCFLFALQPHPTDHGFQFLQFSQSPQAFQHSQALPPLLALLSPPGSASAITRIDSDTAPDQSSIPLLMLPYKMGFPVGLPVSFDD